MSWINCDYLRVSISGTLELQGDMHLGSGYEDTMDLRNPREKGQACFAYGDVCRDQAGQAYIPASSLRGFIRQRLAELLGEADPDFKALVGYSNETVKAANGDTIQVGNAGLMRCYDATSTCARDATKLISRTSIEPITGSAQAQHLFSQAMVPAATRFEVSIALDYVSKTQLAALLAVLNSIQGRVIDSLGRGKTIAQGRVKWYPDGVSVLNQKAAAEWLAQPVSEQWKMSELTANSLSDYAGFTEQLNQGVTHQRCFNITLHPLSPILINDTQAVEQAPDSEDAKLIATRKNQRLCVPGASLKGMIRAQCRRILMTILFAALSQNETDQQAAAISACIASKLLNDIFGGENQRGKFYVMDALSREGEFVKDHLQTFNAIDRFTGGVANGKLYSVKAAYAENLDSEVVIYWPEKVAEGDSDQADSWQWAKGLLYLCLRDAMEQQLAIGWGKARGYGCFELSITAAGSNNAYRVWDDFYRRQNSKIKQAVAALHVRLQEEISQALIDGKAVTDGKAVAAQA